MPSQLSSLQLFNWAQSDLPGFLWPFSMLKLVHYCLATTAIQRLVTCQVERCWRILLIIDYWCSSSSPIFFFSWARVFIFEAWSCWRWKGDMFSYRLVHTQLIKWCRCANDGFLLLLPPFLLPCNSEGFFFCRSTKLRLVEPHYFTHLCFLLIFFVLDKLGCVIWLYWSLAHKCSL